MAPQSPADLLRALPQVDEVLRLPEVHALESLLPRTMIANFTRQAIDNSRQRILADALVAFSQEELVQDIRARALSQMRPSLRRTINATGIVLHTNLGRSPLAPEALEAVVQVASGYSTLEYNTNTQSRGSRHSHIEDLICQLTGAEAAMAVNNNAAAVMMVLHEFARGGEAVVSRGELVEIGGSFRIPDIMELSQARMIEVGTTNKTHLADYERVLSEHTALLLKVHPSNYQVVGFTESVSIENLHDLAQRENCRRGAQSESNAQQVVVYEDQGSGAFMQLNCLNAHRQSTVSESLRAGCNLVSFSGDKLLGGPQAGIIAGSHHLIERLKKNPFARAMRLDKMTLAALEATLRLYLNPAQALKNIPTLRMLTELPEVVHQRAQKLAALITEEVSENLLHVDVVAQTARAGGGSLPLYELESSAVRLIFLVGSAQSCETYLVSKREVPVVGRIQKEAILLDARTLTEDDLPEIADALQGYFTQLKGRSDRE